MTSIIKVDQIQTTAGTAPTAIGLGFDVAGTILTSKTFRPSSGDNLAVTANADVQWWNESFTTKRDNSKILITYHSGQIASPNTSTNGEINARLAWSVNNTTSGVGVELWRDHNHEWYRIGSGASDARFFITGQALSNSVSAGTHTIYAHVGAYNGPLTFGHQADHGDNNRKAIITFQEIAG